MTTVEIVFLGVYFAVLCVLAIYGSHRYRMAFLYYRHKFKIPTPNGTLAQLPRVTIQLPVFNEMYVVERLIEASPGLLRFDTHAIGQPRSQRDFGNFKVAAAELAGFHGALLR